VWIRDVDVPSELIDAARAGQLVIFVGAGASRDAPAGLPDFRSLIQGIGRAVGSTPDETDLQHPDVYLGRLADKGIDVHQLVSNAIDLTGSQPNALHRAIVKLAGIHPPARIVTTNYDTHITAAAIAEGLAFPVYEAPALPVGDDFEGVVHLHGSLMQEPRRLVATDKDFGRAYLLEAWAARFLERMFSAFTVLFIGYSHGDVVMQYLARSLGPSGKRFVCTSDSDNPAWRQFGLTPVAYTVVDGTHAALPTFMARWAEVSAMGHTEHRALIIDLVSAGPPTIPEEVSYLEEVLEHPERIRYFVEKARGPGWFNWVADRPAFRALFDPDRAGSEAARSLIAWVADNYMLDESTSSLALRAMRDKIWPPHTWQTVVHRLFAHDGEMSPWLSPWLIVALQNTPPGINGDMLDMLLARKVALAGNFDAALALFEHRTHPSIKSAISFTDPDAARFEVRLAGDEHWLSKAWSDVFIPMLDVHIAPIIASIDEQISRLYRLLHNVSPDFDALNFRRSAIEPHEQDSFRESIDVLIDAARDCIEHALEHELPLADRYVAAWVDRSDAIFRRLAVHAARVRTDWTLDEKIRWLEAQNWLWEVPLQHEVYLLLQHAIPNASDGPVRTIVDAAKAGPPRDPDGEVPAYRSYNLLTWLYRYAPDRASVAEAFDEYQAAHPQFAPREHPDLNRYMTTGTVENALPFTADELHAKIAEDPASAVSALREYQTSSLVFTGPTWHGAMRSLQACVAAHPGDGLAVAGVLGPGDSELRNAIIHGWDTADLDEHAAGEVLTAIDSWDPDEIRYAAATMLSNGGTQQNPTPWHRYARARRSARNLWPMESVNGAIGSGEDILLEAINHPAGNLAQFWTKVVQWNWTQAGEAWEGLTNEVAAELDRMVSAEDHNGLLACTFLASQLHFYFGADPDWAISRLLPIFDWKRNEKRALGAWQGFLTWGRFNDGLLAAGLLDGLMETCRHQSALDTTLQHHLATEVALIALRGGPNPLEWLPLFVLGAPEELRVSWATQVGNFLEELDPSESEAEWDRWISVYWSRRLQSTPLPLTTSEASAMACWLIGLPGIRSQVVELLVKAPAGLPQDIGFLYRIHDLDLTADAANWATAITHLLRGTRGPIWGIDHYLEDIVQQLRGADPTLDLSAMIDEALRLGATDASDW
jgi:hypothetical protein